ncbi:hypothetical protein DM860_008293 [Cuscuta australis]|uniref:Uncharacterized protein n=1 Tax=Cuscuta australis TaxID=267555 RepID=A0A328D862_9ASTE|nr:hypothetical protein DM860_008293 [Cuscuta australis]
MIGNCKSWGVVVTTFHALEGVFLEILKKINCFVLEKARVKEFRNEALTTVKTEEGSIECSEELVKQLAQLQAL